MRMVGLGSHSEHQTIDKDQSIVERYMLAFGERIERLDCQPDL